METSQMHHDSHSEDDSQPISDERPTATALTPNGQTSLPTGQSINEDLSKIKQLELHLARHERRITELFDVVPDLSQRVAELEKERESKHPSAEPPDTSTDGTATGQRDDRSVMSVSPTAEPPAAEEGEEPVVRLTPREHEVMRLIAAGLSNPAIADELFISPHTVDAHVRSIYRKLDAGSRIEAILKAHDRGLV